MPKEKAKKQSDIIKELRGANAALSLGIIGKEKEIDRWKKVATEVQTEIYNEEAKFRKAESQWSNIVLALEIANDRLRRAMTDLVINMSDAGRVDMIKRRRFDPDNGYIADVPREG